MTARFLGDKAKSGNLPPNGEDSRLSLYHSITVFIPAVNHKHKGRYRHTLDRGCTDSTTHPIIFPDQLRMALPTLLHFPPIPYNFAHNSKARRSRPTFWPTPGFQSSPILFSQTTPQAVLYVAQPLVALVNTALLRCFNTASGIICCATLCPESLAALGLPDHFLETSLQKWLLGGF